MTGYEDIIAKCRFEVQIYRRIHDFKYIHIAILISAGKIVKYEFNDYSRNYANRKLFPSIHAEFNCCRNIGEGKGNKSSKKYRLLVLSFNKLGELRDSRPCYMCRDMLLTKGFKYVYCSTACK